jgi:GNAT superfamily N-acetyltransferase
VEHDLPQVIDIDHRVTGIAKPEFWDDIFERYGNGGSGAFLSRGGARGGRRLVGFVVGEVRAWEFGSEPCGWLFAMSVDPKARQQHVGEQLVRGAERTASARPASAPCAPWCRATAPKPWLSSAARA